MAPEATVIPVSLPAGTVPGGLPPPSEIPGGAPGTKKAKSDDRWYDKLVNGVQLYGQKTLNYRWLSVKGSPNAKRAFERDTLPYGNLTQLSVMGHFLDVFDVNVTLSDNRFGVNQNRMSLKYHNGGTAVTLGDVATSLQGNTLIPFNRTLRALMVERQIDRRTKFTGLVSETQTTTRRIDVPGNNTVGPYYLNAFPIIVDSVRVRIDELEAPRDSFTVDAYAGTITFKPGNIVPQTSTIHVSFEAQSDGGPAGTLWGFRASHALGARSSIGATLLMSGEVNSPDAGDVRERTDDWIEGHADSNGPYQLRYGPVVRGSEQVFVAGVLQQPNRDYYIQYDRGVIQFTRIVLTSEPIRVLYRQVRDGQLQETIAGEGAVGPYRLTRSPLVSGSESIVRVEPTGVSVPLVRDVDYRIDYTTGTITFLRAPLARGQSAVVLYQPRQRIGTPQANRVMGFDGNLALGKHTRLAAQVAHSSGNDGASGTGMTLEARTGLLPGKFNGGSPRLSLGATWKKIDPDFAGMDTVGFQRNEQGIGLDGEFLMNEHVRFFSRWDRSRRPLGFGAVSGSDSLYDTVQSYSGATVAYPKLPELSYTRMHLNADGPGGASAQASDSLQLRYKYKQIGVGAEYLNTSSSNAQLLNGGLPYGLVGSTPTTPGTPGAASTARTTKLFASYTPGTALALTATLANSDIRSGNKPTHAKNLDLNAIVRPLRGLQITADYQVSNGGSSLAGTLPNPTGLTPTVDPRGGGTPPFDAKAASNGGTPYPTVGIAQAGPAFPATGNASGLPGVPGTTNGGASTGYGTLLGGSAPTSPGLSGGYGSPLGSYNAFSGGVLGGYGSLLGGTGLGYGSGFYGGNTTSRRLGMSYSPGSRLSLTLNLDRSESELYGSSTGHALGATLAPARWLGFAGTLSHQKAGFVNPDRPSVTDSATQSDLLFLSMRVGPVRKLTFNLDFQDMRADNTSGLASRLPGTGSPILTTAAMASHIRSLTGRVAYPFGDGRRVFAEIQTANYRGASLAARRQAIAAGVEVAINRILGVTVGVELHNYRDARHPENSYRARLLNANLAARF